MIDASGPGGAPLMAADTERVSIATLDRAWQSTVENQRPLLVMFTSDNCAYCVKMVRETYRHPSIERLLTGRTEGVLAHASDNQALVSRLGIRGYPTSMLVSPRGEVLMVVEGFLDAEAFALRVGPLLNPQARATVPANSGVAIRAVSQ